MWDWIYGVDGGKPQAKTSHNEEAGAFQVSADSMGNGQSLKDYAQATLGATDDAAFISGMKSNDAFAIEYTVRLLRITINPSRAVREQQKHLRPAEPGIGEGVQGLSRDPGRLPEAGGRHALRLTRFGRLLFDLDPGRLDQSATTA